MASGGAGAGAMGESTRARRGSYGRPGPLQAPRLQRRATDWPPEGFIRKNEFYLRVY